MAETARAATWMWTGYTSGDMSVATNYWNGSANGVPGATDVVEFNALGYYSNSPALNSPLAIGGLWFASDDADGAATDGTAALTLNATTINGNSSTGIELDAGSGAATIGAPLQLGNSQTWLNNSTSQLTIGGSLGLGSTTLTIGGSGIGGVDLAGPISGTSAGGLTINSGPVTISGNNTGYSGLTILNSSGVLLNIENAGALGSGALQFENTGTAPNIAIDAPLSNLTLANTVNDQGLVFIGSHNLTFGALNIQNQFGNFILNSGTLAFSGAATNGFNSSTVLNISVGGYDSTVTTGNLNLAAGLTLTDNASQSTFQFSGFNNVTVGGVVASGTNANAGLIFGPTLSTTTLFLTGANTFKGGLTIEGGIVSTGPGGTLGNSGAASSIGQSGTITINGAADNTLGGTLQYANTSGTNESTNVQITIGANAVIDASGSNQITFSNTAALTVSATSATSLTLTGTGAGVFDPKIVNGSGSGTVSFVKTGTGPSNPHTFRKPG